MSDDISPRRKLALEVIDAYRSWDIDRIMAFRTDSCMHEIAPKSLQQAPKDNETYRKYWASISPLFSNFEPTIHDIVEDPRENKLIVWASSTGSTVLGPYANEYMLLLYFNAAGDKIERFVEFVDSDNSRTVFSRLRKFAEERAAKTS